MTDLDTFWVLSMMSSFFFRVLFFMMSALTVCGQGMLETKDWSSQWWAEGFPKVVKGAPWLRVMETGYFALVVDTEKVSVPHFGALKEGEDWRSLPAASLKLSVAVNGKIYHHSGAQEISRQGGPRLVEAGNLFQRADVTGVTFVSEDGEALEVAARFETAVWPDRVGFIFHAESIEGTPWENAHLRIQLMSQGKAFDKQAKGSTVSISLDPVTLKEVKVSREVKLKGADVKVNYDDSLNLIKVNLDEVSPEGSGNDILERVPFVIQNDSRKEEVVRLMFEKTGKGLSGKLGSSITGISAILCDEMGNPLGLPVQLSKNWHRRADSGPYQGSWFHGMSQVRVPAGKAVKLQLVLAYAHWGGVAAASHAQLSLIGWGSNQRWEESAMGAWGESICYEPEQGQPGCVITDVRPLMVKGMKDEKKWGWTSNVGGGDFFRMEDADGKRHFHRAVKVEAYRQGPCLTEVEFKGELQEGVDYSVMTSISRSDDLVRGIYRIRLDVSEGVDFSRFVFFQVGADFYNFTREKRFVLGDVSGKIEAYTMTPGGNVYHGERVIMSGEIPWVSLEGGTDPKGQNPGAWADRGIVVREWKAVLGGKKAAPCFSQRGVTRGRSSEYATIDLVPPAGVTRFEKGDFVEAVLEYVVMPQNADDYYGPNEALRSALKRDAGSWKMMFREVSENARVVTMKKGTFLRTFPDVRVKSVNDGADFELKAGLGYVPVTVTGLKGAVGYELLINGEKLDQAVHGNDFWQTDYDVQSGTWSRTYNVPMDGVEKAQVTLRPTS